MIFYFRKETVTNVPYFFFVVFRNVFFILTYDKNDSIQDFYL